MLVDHEPRTGKLSAESLAPKHLHLLLLLDDDLFTAARARREPSALTSLRNRA
jgi:hypothetical protein